MPCGVLSGVPDVITHAKFCVNRLRGFSAAAPPKVPFPVLIPTTLTTVLHHRADCDIKRTPQLYMNKMLSNCRETTLQVVLVLELGDNI